MKYGEFLAQRIKTYFSPLRSLNGWCVRGVSQYRKRERVRVRRGYMYRERERRVAYMGFSYALLQVAREIQRKS